MQWVGHIRGLGLDCCECKGCQTRLRHWIQKPNWFCCFGEGQPDSLDPGTREKCTDLAGLWDLRGFNIDFISGVSRQSDSQGKS